ncbi:hypothetical protein HDU76_013359 [Blyttiomyces sp. JEL0837]|nr:hypothetical protein HDU76_013359 [Blyttiomyces sp. JEL0837]
MIRGLCAPRLPELADMVTTIAENATTKPFDLMAALQLMSGGPTPLPYKECQLLSQMNSFANIAASSVDQLKELGIGGKSAMNVTDFFEKESL